MKDIIVAIDGYSSSGKSTMARELAAAVGYAYVDSGAMYRAVTLYAMRHGIVRPDGSLDTAALEAALPEIHVDFRVPPGEKASHTFLNGEDVEREIRTMAVSSHVSPVAAVGAVRRALTAMMQAYGSTRRIVMDGRDIGTAVFPDAEMKVFVDASPEVRARRRHAELLAKGDEADFEEVLRNVRERDHIDRTRKESPLRQAPDALVLDNDHMSREEQAEWLLTQFRRIADA